MIEAGFLPTGERFPVIRSGERAPIPYHVRAAVWLRDRGVCQKCKARSPKPWELDHIIPWSAGGTDTSENLRVLCQDCNQERSNYDDRETFAKRPVTWWCQRCYDGSEAYGQYADGRLACVVHRGFCHLKRIIKWQAESGESTDWFFFRAYVENARTIAHCAHCGSPGLTDVTL